LILDPNLRSETGLIASLSLAFRFERLLAEIRLLVEHAEHVQEDEGMKSFEHSKPGGPCAHGSYDGVQTVHQGQDELDYLHFGDVSLPPQVFAPFGSGTGQGVVRVHDRVNEHVQQRKEAAVEARMEFQSEPTLKSSDVIGVSISTVCNGGRGVKGER
jgi:hypothetical protein